MKKKRLNLTVPLVITVVLMVFMVTYTSSMFYRISVSNIYEVGSDKISGISANLGNYLDTAKSVLWVTADTVDYMIKDGEPSSNILNYLQQETSKHKSQFDENYTGVYGYIGGEYLDGLAWEPPADYDPTQRDWYNIAREAEGKLVIVPPYIDAQTGSLVISVAKQLADPKDVISLDVFTNHIQDIIEETNIKGKGYGFIVDNSGTVIAHADKSLNGTDFHDADGGSEFMDKLSGAENGRFETELGGKMHTVFVESIMDQWYVVIAVGNDELFRDVYTQLAVNIAANTAVFVLIALFYIVAYRKEQKISRQAEAYRIREQQKNYEAEILRLEKSAADNANKAKGDFLAQMSHEIRTPINAVLGMNEMILRESNDDTILEYSENIQSAGKTLLTLINSILDFSKIEDGKMEIIPVKYETPEMISALYNSVAERAKAQGLEFKVNADPELPSVMIGDDVRITQIIVNLLTNAVKYTERGSVTLDIKCRERTDTDITLAISVSDTGIGIREEDIAKLSETFSRLDEERNRHIEGTGLGMAIVTNLLALMDSKLNVESTYGKGSVFSFYIKQKIADKTPVGSVSQHRTDRPDRKKQYPKYTGTKVLITDDNEMNLKVAANLLKLFGIKPDLASSGAETIELMKKETYQIVFLDHMMPEMDGIETLEALKTQQLIPEGTTVIALTANAVLGAKEKYLEAGFADYLSKPIELDEMAEQLAKRLTPQTAPAAEAPAPEPQEEPVNTEGGFIAALTRAGVNASSGLKYCMEDEDFYREMLTDYADSCPQRLAELSSALEAQDIKLYRTLIHSLKSTSKTVGVNDVSELAKALEDAAKAGDSAFIDGHHQEVVTLFETKTAKLREILNNT